MLRYGICGMILIGVGLASVSPAAAQEPGWLLRQADLEVARLTGSVVDESTVWCSEIAGGSSLSPTQRDVPAVPMLMSLILPGAGEVYLGHKRGFLQMALDAASWFGAANAGKKGEDMVDEYMEFADDHWFLEKFDAAYDPGYPDRPGEINFDYVSTAGFAQDYFQPRDENGAPSTSYTHLPLWVSASDDRREYYENLGKWDQFVFGWDDFRDPRGFIPGLDPNESNDADITNLQDPRTSSHREEYRDMRKKSNDYYADRDRFIYLSMAFRVFSVLQVAYLEGLLFGGGGGDSGGGPETLRVGQHKVDFFVEPVGYSRGVIGATVSF